MTRRSPSRNVPADELIEFLDRYAIIDVGADPRSYINNVWVDPIHKREIRRWRNGHVRSVRPETARNLLNFFNLEEQWQTRAPRQT